MWRCGSSNRKKAFTLIELLVVVAIILILMAILLPTLGKARDLARGASCASYLRTFGSGFEMYAAQDPDQARSSSAFDHLRDGDVRNIGWVADIMNLRIGVPGRMLCPVNRWTLNEKVADYMGAATTGQINPLRWPSGPPTIPIVPVGQESKEFWTKGYNTNYATSWHFSRGDPTAADGYGSNGDPSDPSKCPNDGDGPLSDRHLSASAVGPERIVVMGDSRAGDASDSQVTQAYATAMNNFAGERIARVGDWTVESFTDGMSVDYSTVTGDPGRMGHEFNDIAPIHSPQSGDWTGGYANVLFADGHVAAVSDRGGLNNKPDGYLGPYRSGTQFVINQSAYDEIHKVMWFGRVRAKSLPGGGSIE